MPRRKPKRSRRTSGRAGDGRANSGRARDVLIERWRGAAVGYAAKIARATRARIGGDELESEAMWGLLRAIERFDPSRGAKFGTYLYHKVRSAVLSYVRDATHRADRSRVRFHSLEGMTDLAPGGWKSLDDANRAACLASYGLSVATGSAAVRVTEAPARETGAERAERRETVALAMRPLRWHPRLRRVVRLYFYEGCTLYQVGVRMGFSEQRAMQLLHRALHMMRRDMRARGISEGDVL